MKNYSAIKKYGVVALMVIITATLLTVPVYAAGIMDGLNGLKNNIMEAAAILFTIGAVGGGGWTFVKTRNKAATIGVILFFVVLIGFAKGPDILTSWGVDVAGWFNG